MAVRKKAFEGPFINFLEAVPVVGNVAALGDIAHKLFTDPTKLTFTDILEPIPGLGNIVAGTEAAAKHIVSPFLHKYVDIARPHGLEAIGVGLKDIFESAKPAVAKVLPVAVPVAAGAAGYYIGRRKSSHEMPTVAYFNIYDITYDANERKFAAYVDLASIPGNIITTVYERNGDEAGRKLASVSVFESGVIKFASADELVSEIDRAFGDYLSPEEEYTIANNIAKLASLYAKLLEE